MPNTQVLKIRQSTAQGSKTQIMLLQQEADKTASLLMNTTGMARDLAEKQVPELNASNIRLFMLYHVVSDSLNSQDKDDLEKRLTEINDGMFLLAKGLGDAYVADTIGIKSMEISSIAKKYSESVDAGKFGEWLFSTGFELSVAKSNAVDINEFLQFLVLLRKARDLEFENMTVVNDVRDARRDAETSDIEPTVIRGAEAYREDTPAGDSPSTPPHDQGDNNPKKTSASETMVHDDGRIEPTLRRGAGESA